MRTVFARRGWAVVAAAAWLTAGCGPPATGKVTGTVTAGGQPVKNGTITFSHTEGNRDVFSAAVKDGKYETGDIPVGLTKVSVVARMGNPAESGPAAKPAEGIGAGLGPADGRPPPKAGLRTAEIPAKYNDPGTSGLTYEVVKGPNKKDFDLSP